MKRLLFFCILSFFAVGCRQSPQRAFVIGRVVAFSSPEEERLIHPVDSLSGPSLFGGIMLAGVADSLVIIGMNPLVSNIFCFRAVNVRNEKYVDFLNRGRGPGEVTSAGSAGLRREGGKMFFDADAMNDRLMLTIDIGATFHEGKTVVKKETGLPKGPVLPYSFLAGNEIVSVALFDEDFYSIKQYDASSKELRRVSRMFGEEPYLSEYYVGFGSRVVMKPDETRLALAMERFDEIGIFDLTGEDHISVSSSKRTDAGRKIAEMLSTDAVSETIYYRDCKTTDDGIFALYCGDCSEVDASRPVVQVFSWDGKLKAIYHFDEYLSSIAISEDGKTLYGLTEDEVLYRYDLTL